MFSFYRSAINSHNDAIIMPYLCHNYGILRHFCKNPVCADPVWKPVNLVGMTTLWRVAGGRLVRVPYYLALGHMLLTYVMRARTYIHSYGFLGSPYLGHI